MAKRPQPQAKQLTRKQISRREAEQRYARRVVIVGAAVLAAVIAVIAWGVISLYVVKPSRAVATVAGVPIRLSSYEKLLRYRRYDYHSYLDNLNAQRQQYASMGDSASYVVDIIDQQIQYVQSQLTYAYSSVLEELISDEVTRQECALRGITVSEDEINAELESQFGYERYTPTPTATATTTPTLAVAATPTATLTPTATQVVTSTATVTLTPEPTATASPTMSYDDFTTQSKEWLSTIRKGSGFGEQDYRELVRASLLRNKLEEAIRQEVPLTAEHAHVLQILVATQEEANSVLSRYTAGDEWSKLAATVSTDSATKDNNGDMGWLPKGQKGDSIDAVVFGPTIDPKQAVIVQDDAGFHVLRVLERQADRFLSEADLETARSTAVTDWFSARTSADTVVRLLDYATQVPPDPYESTTTG